MEDAPAPTLAVDQGGTDTLVAPPITIVMVTHDPGVWFDETLNSLAEQDYPNLGYLIIDVASTGAVAERVHAVLPDAQVFALNANPGFGAAANEILDAQGLPPYVLLCHDDVALSPDAVRRLFEEAIRSNAGILGPKIVDWDDERLILEVGIGVDKTGVQAPYAEHGEFDQEQHDAVRDVFALSSTAMLVRTDLFRALGGFDEVMTYRSEDVDLCWRAHVAGARVMVVPLAVARHRETLSRQMSEADQREDRGVQQSEQRNRVRMLLSNYGTGHAVRVLPQALIAAVASVVHAVFRGRFDRARAIVGAWTWNLANLGSIATKRRNTSKLRQLSDGEVRRFQVPGFDAVNRYIQSRADFDVTDDSSRLSRALAFTRTGAGQVTLALWVGVIAVVGFGSRHVLTQGVPLVNEFAAVPEGLGELWASVFSGFRNSGLGTEGFGPLLHGALAVLGTGLFGQMGLLRTLLTVGMLAVGAVGMVRLVAPFQSSAARALAPAIYLATPLPYNSLVAGSWSALVLFGMLPWTLRRLASFAGVSPYATDSSPVRMATRALGLGLSLAVAALIVPFVFPLVGGMTLVWIVGGWVAGRAGRAPLLAVGGIIGTVIGLVLHLPWVLQFTGSRASMWRYFAGTRSVESGDLGIADLLRLSTGPHGSGLLGWSIVAVAAFSLILANGDRLIWAVRGWFLVLSSVALAWLGQVGAIEFAVPRVEVLLAPAGLGLAIAATMLVIAVERDLGSFRFGFRQVLPGLAIISLLGAATAGAGAALDGRWEMPRGGYETALRFLDDGESDVARVLWIGHADALPVGGFAWSDSTVGVSAAANPTVVDLAPHPDPDGQAVLTDVLDTAMARGTNRVGRLLAPMGVRHIVVVEQAAPAPFVETTIPASPQVLRMLTEQLDLERMEVREGMTVYRNASWLPLVAEVDSGLASQVSTPTSATITGRDLSASRARFTPDDPRTWTGQVSPDTEVHFGVAQSPNWKLVTDDGSAGSTRSFGWANAWPVDNDGDATLRYETPITYRLLVLGFMALWAVAFAVVFFGDRAARAQHLQQSQREQRQ